MATTHTNAAVPPAPSDRAVVAGERKHTAVPPLHHDEHKSHNPQIDPRHAVLNFRDHEIPARGAAYLALTLLIIAFALAGILTELYASKDGPNRTSISLWKSCQTTELGGSRVNSTCRDTDDGAPTCYLGRINVLRAFGIMVVVIAFFVCLPLAIFDLFHELPPRTGKNIMATIALLLFCFTLVYWGIVVGMWYHGCDGVVAAKNIPKSRYGPSGPLFIVAWVFALCQLIAALILPGIEFYYPHKYVEEIEPQPNPEIVQMQPTRTIQPDPLHEPRATTTAGAAPVAGQDPLVQPSAAPLATAAHPDPLAPQPARRVNSRNEPIVVAQ